MYMILQWTGKNDNEVRAVCNKNGTVTLFYTVAGADAYANSSPYNENMRVISVEAVEDPTDA